MPFSLLKNGKPSIRHRFNLLFSTSLRFLIPLLVVVCVKAIGSFILYRGLNMDLSDPYWMTVEREVEGQNEILRSGVDGLRWPYLFLGWDSAWYLSILHKGYLFSTQSVAFFPGLILFSKVLNLFVNNLSISLIIFSTFVGILCIPVYQLVAENYLDKSEALRSTLLYMFFPYVFLFTTVIYSESLFLFSTLSAWYFFKREKLLPSMVFTSIATISRPPGLLILLPILLGTLQKQSWRHSGTYKRLAIFLLPVFSFSAWLLYCKIVFNDWVAPFTRSGWNNMPSLFSLLCNLLFTMPNHFHPQNVLLWPFLPIPILILLTPFLVQSLRQMDKPLAWYSALTFFGILTFGALVSTPRFLSFLFPVWLPLYSKLFQVKHRNVLTVILCMFFCLIGLFFWSCFINGLFIS